MRVALCAVAVLCSVAVAVGQDAGAEFEVVSVKPARTSAEAAITSLSGHTLLIPSMTVERLIVLAYRVAPFQIVGGPDWITRDRFEVRAKLPDADVDGSLVTQQQERLSVMFRSLLAERFHLRAREERHTLRRYVLRPSDLKGGTPRGMRPPDPSCGQRREEPTHGEPPSAATNVGCGIHIDIAASRGVISLSAGSTSMPELLGTLEGFVGRYIDDQSGVSGRFGLQMMFGSEQAVALETATSAPRSSGPSLAEALADGMNLSLRSEMGPVPVVVVEHVEPPTSN